MRDVHQDRAESLLGYVNDYYPTEEKIRGTIEQTIDGAKDIVFTNHADDEGGVPLSEVEELLTVLQEQLSETLTLTSEEYNRLRDTIAGDLEKIANEEFASGQEDARADSDNWNDAWQSGYNEGRGDLDSYYWDDAWQSGYNEGRGDLDCLLGDMDGELGTVTSDGNGNVYVEPLTLDGQAVEKEGSELVLSATRERVELRRKNG